MYYLTGLPGWMRFGFSPGWLGRSPTGLGPTASYLMTGQWPTPQAQAYWQAMQAGQAPYPMYGGPGTMPYSFPQAPGTTPGAAPFAPGAAPFAPGAAPFAPEASPEQELSFLRNQASALKSQIDQINSRIKELEKTERRE